MIDVELILFCTIWVDHDDRWCAILVVKWDLILEMLFNGFELMIKQLRTIFGVCYVQVIKSIDRVDY